MGLEMGMLIVDDSVLMMVHVDWKGAWGNDIVWLACWIASG